MRVIAIMSTPDWKASISPFLNLTQPIFLKLCGPTLSALSKDARQHTKLRHKDRLIGILQHAMTY